MESPLAQKQTKANSIREDLIYSVLPLLKLISLTVIGLILAHPKTQLVPKATFKLLSKLVFALFLPCLIFIHLGEVVTLKNFMLWWFIPINVILSTAIGTLLGLLVTEICKPPPQYIRFTIIMTAFGNTGNLHLAIVGSICHSPDNPFGPDCQKKGTAYVSFAQWIAVLLVFTFVYHVFERKPLGSHEVVEEGIEIPEYTELIAEADDMSESSIVQKPDSLDSPKSLIRIVAEKTPFSHIILQPPTFATLLAFIVGMVPSMKSFVYGENAPLSFVMDSLEILAGAMVPSVMLVLGGMLAEGPNKSRLGIRTIIGISVARLLVLPLIGIGVVCLADKFGILISGDKMYKFVLLLQYTTPSAILLGAIARLKGYAVSEASAVLFWQHVFAVFSLGIYVVVYFRMLQLPYV